MATLAWNPNGRQPSVGTSVRSTQSGGWLDSPAAHTSIEQQVKDPERSRSRGSCLPWEPLGVWLRMEGMSGAVLIIGVRGVEGGGWGLRHGEETNVLGHGIISCVLPWCPVSLSRSDIL